jgi:hypothetical protein
MNYKKTSLSDVQAEPFHSLLSLAPKNAICAQRT